MLPARPRATCCTATPPSPSASPCRAAVSRRVIACGLLDRAVLRLLHRFQQRDAAAPLRSDRMPAVRAPTTPAERDPPRSGACRSAESPAEVRVSASSRRDASIGTRRGHGHVLWSHRTYPPPNRSRRRRRFCNSILRKSARIPRQLAFCHDPKYTTAGKGGRMGTVLQRPPPR